MGVQIPTGTGNRFEASSISVVPAYSFTMMCNFKCAHATSIHRILNVSKTGFTNYFAMVARGDVGGDPLHIFAQVVAVGNATTSTGYSANTQHHGTSRQISATSRNVRLDGGGQGGNTTNVTPTGQDTITLTVLNNVALSDSGGAIDYAWIVFWSVTLTDEEVVAAANGAWPFHIRPDKITHWYPCMRDEALDLISGDDFTKLGSSTVVESPSLASHFMAA